MLKSRSSAPAFDPLAFATAMAEAQARGMAQLAEMVGLRRELQPTAPPDAAEKYMAGFREGMEIGKLTADTEGGGMGEVAKAIASLVATVAGAKGAPAPAVEVAAPAQVVRSAPVDPVLAAIEMLAPMAAGGSERAEAWADVVSEQIPGLEPRLDELIQLAGSVAQMLDYAERMHPAVKAHRNFFARVVEYLAGADEPEAGGDVQAE